MRVHHFPRGQALIQVMIAMGLLSVIALTYAQLHSDAAKSQGNVRFDNEFNNAVNMVSILMQNTPICTYNVTRNTASTQFDPNASSPIKIGMLTSAGGGSAFIRPGASPAQAPDLTITKLELLPTQVLTPGTRYLANVHVEGTKPTGRFLGSSVLSQNVVIALQTAPAGGGALTIKGCGAGPTLPTCPPGATLISDGSTWDCLQNFPVTRDCRGSYCAATQATADQLCVRHGLSSSPSFQIYSVTSSNPNGGGGYTGDECGWNGGGWSCSWGGQCNTGGKCTPMNWGEIFQVSCK